MKQVITGLLALIGCFISAQEKNLIANGKLDCGTSEVPYYWVHDSGSGVCFPDGGPDNMGEMARCCSGKAGLILFPAKNTGFPAKFKPGIFVPASRVC